MATVNAFTQQGVDLLAFSFGAISCVVVIGEWDPIMLMLSTIESMILMWKPGKIFAARRLGRCME